MAHLHKFSPICDSKTKARPMQDLRGARAFRDQDLTDWCLFGIDGRGMDLRGCVGTNVDLRCANLRDAKLQEADTSGWYMTGANLEGAVLDGATIGATLDGAVMYHASMEGVTWRSGGKRCYGLRLPGNIPFHTWTLGCGCHPVMARALQQLFPEDPEIDLLINAILAEPFRYVAPYFPCWDGALSYLTAHLSHRTDEMIAAAQAFPGMLMAERLELARLLRSTDDPATLKAGRYYELFPFDIDWACQMKRRATPVSERT